MSGKSSESKDIPLIVVSSRLPYQIPASHDTQSNKKLTKSVSGLVTALEGLSEESLWIGGVIKDDVEEFKEHLPAGENQKIELHPVPIESTIYNKHKKWCNVILWFVFHGMMLSYVKKIADECHDYWESYKKVNQVYAESIKEQLSKQVKNAIVWIHDYHLFLVPNLLKQLLAEKPLKIRYRIGFFLHIPFPPVETFEQIPNYQEILDGMLGYDSIGFHTRKYRDNFLKCCEKHKGCTFKPLTDDSYELQLGREGRKVLVQVVPAGIVYKTFSDQSKEEFSEKFPEDLKTWVNECSKNPKTLLIGVDRIDHTKGLLRKVDAFQELLEKRKLSHKVFFLQIAVPCRDTEPKYEELKKELKNRVGNFKYQSNIRLHLESLSQQDLSVLYKKADVALVTPLIDGLNLVALEYIACQPAEPGVLILSKKTGAAEYIHDDDALKVDPENEQEMEETMYQAISMNSKERRERMKRLQHQVQEKFISERWVQLSLKPLRERVEHIAKL
ncbi:alpha,alpha-trehalose-phosphate synthase [UDP-forming]-like isoform X1 [Actinia tenebrosa]|uniref:Alpha,alpha-trehalose-phosphate synthase [UDP-forming]-like isoform X1 n=1 Tax=Actinia tenebrosa TaxID=6105 RepID=A0A6P8IIM4_ACTTE|nr:alpha,alpha-trehalose-phosphate synthase [UDP-forming]-like isoform X1 [Actinia tenebrosa]